MAHIVEFRTSVEREPLAAEAAPARGAEIIIFPGVRRERHVQRPDEPQDEAKCRGGTPPERDLLVLPD